MQAFGVVFKILTCGFAAMAFLHLKWSKIRLMFAAVYYWPVIVIGVWMCIVSPILTLVIKSRKAKDVSTEKKDE